MWITLTKSSAPLAKRVSADYFGVAKKPLNAKDLCPVDTGNLRNSISAAVIDGKEVRVGTPTEYAIYQEMGTGKYAEGGGGRPTPWKYQDAQGIWHWTAGNRAHPFIKPSIADHQGTYKNILKDELSKGD